MEKDMKDMILDRWKGPVYLFCAFTFAGTSVISARFVSGKLGTFTISAVSLFFALSFLLPLYGKKVIITLRTLTVWDCFNMCIQALFGIFLFRMFLLIGLMFTSSGEAGILTGATPAITAILAMVLLKEPANGKKLIGILSTVGGIFLIQGLLISEYDFSMEHFWGNVLVLCAAASESLFNTFSRVFAVKTASGERSQVNPTVQTTIVTAIAFLLCLFPAMFEKPALLLAGIGVKEWLSLLWYGLFVTALAFIFWYGGIKRCGAFTAAAFSGMMPFTAMLLSMAVLKESIGWQQWSGGILIVIGMMLIRRGQST